MKKERVHDFKRGEDLLIVRVGKGTDIPPPDIFEDICKKIGDALENDTSLLVVPSIVDFEIIKGFNKRRKNDKNIHSSKL